MTITSRAHLSDATLVRQACDHTAREFRMTGEHLADLAEIDARRAYRAEAFTSMLDFCTRGLRLTEDEARLRIRLARKGREIPGLFDAIADGRLRLTAVDVMAARLTADNAAELVAAAAHRTIAELREMLAARFPKPDIADRIEPLLAGEPVVQEVSSERGSNPVGELDPVGAADDGEPLATFRLAPPPLGGPRTKVEPLSAGSLALHCTIRASTHEKLRYARSLLGGSVPRCDLDALLDRALAALIRELERRKYGITDRPRSRPSRQSLNPRHVPNEVKRAVVARDGGRCTFVSESGRRCEARDRLEFDHVEPVARGGRATVGNLRLRCRAHNQLEAEQAFGADYVQHRRTAAREATGQRRRAREARAKADREQRSPAAAERAKRDAGETARANAIDEVVPWLRALRVGKDEARQAATIACEHHPDAPLELRVRLALRSFARPGRGVVSPVARPAP